MELKTVKVGPKNQVVIPKEARKIAKEIKPGTEVVVTPVDERSVHVRIKPKDWAKETYGIHQKYWKGIDSTKWLKKLRKEWE